MEGILKQDGHDANTVSKSKTMIRHCLRDVATVMHRWRIRPHLITGSPTRAPGGGRIWARSGPTAHSSTARSPTGFPNLTTLMLRC